MKKIFFKPVVLISALFALVIVNTGCNGKPENSSSISPEIGSYKIAAQYVDSDQPLYFPELTLLEDGSFNFSYIIARDYLPNGDYQIKDNQLIARDEVVDERFVFDLIDSQHLRFNPEASTWLQISEDDLITQWQVAGRRVIFQKVGTELAKIKVETYSREKGYVVGKVLETTCENILDEVSFPLGDQISIVDPLVDPLDPSVVKEVLSVNVIFEDYGFGTKPMDLYGVTQLVVTFE